jgi:hypothetical protein
MFYSDWLINRQEIGAITLKLFNPKFSLEPLKFLTPILSFAIEKKFECRWGKKFLLLSFSIQIGRAIAYLMRGYYPPSTYLDSLPILFNGLKRRFFKFFYKDE